MGKIPDQKGKVRVARVIVLAANEMRNLLQTGARPRTDQFFTAQSSFRSHAEEIVEAVLLKAEREPEECKLPYIAKLLAHIPFESSIDVGMAHQLLRFAETLSYRQYCILELARDTSSFDLYDQSAMKIGRDKLSDAQTSFLSDCWDLKGKGLLWTGTNFDIDLYEIHPRHLSLQALGLSLVKRLGLEAIPSEDIASLGNLFVYGHPNVPPKVANQ